MTARRPQGTVVASDKHCVSLIARLAEKGYPDLSTSLFHRETYRWTLQVPAVIRYQTVEGTRMTLDATVEDLSAAGMSLACREPLPDNMPAEVFVSFEETVYSAAVQVVHATPAADKFKIGFRFVVREDR